MVTRTTRADVLDLGLVQNVLHVPLLLRTAQTLDLKRRLLLEHVLPVQLRHLLVVLRSVSTSLCWRAFSFSSRAFFAMPRSSRSVCAPARTASSFSFSEWSVDESGTALPPAKISCRP